MSESTQKCMVQHKNSQFDTKMLFPDRHQLPLPLSIIIIEIIIYHKTSYMSGTSVGNKTIDHSDVVGASPVGAAPTTSSFST